MDKLLLKNRILVIIVVVLIVLNIATLLTIYWQTKKINFPPDYKGTKRPWKHKNFQEYVIKQLQLNTQQSHEYRIADSIFRSKSQQIFSNMAQIREKMLKEILKDKPDTTYLNNLSVLLGNEHIRLKINTFEFLFKLKKICNPEQRELLRAHITNMFEFEKIPSMGRKGKRFNRGDQPWDTSPQSNCNNKPLQPLPPDENPPKE